MRIIIEYTAHDVIRDMNSENSPEDEFCRRVVALVHPPLHITRTFNAEETVKFVGPYSEETAIPLCMLDQRDKAVLCFDFTSTDAAELESKKNLLKAAGIRFVVADPANSPSDDQLKRLVDPLAIQQPKHRAPSMLPDEPESVVTAEKKAASKPSKGSQIFVAALIGLAALQLADFASKKFALRSPGAFFNFGVEEPANETESTDGTVASSTAPAARLEQAIADRVAQKCDLVRPANGVKATFPSEVKVMADGIWTLTNDSDRHAYVWINQGSQPLAEIYIGPNSAYTMKAPKIKFGFKVMMFEKWCNSYKANHEGLLPSLTATSELTSEFRTGVSVNTRFYMHKGYAHLYTTYQPSEEGESQ